MNGMTHSERTMLLVAIVSIAALLLGTVVLLSFAQGEPGDRRELVILVIGFTVPIAGGLLLVLQQQGKQQAAIDDVARKVNGRQDVLQQQLADVTAARAAAEALLAEYRAVDRRAGLRPPSSKEGGDSG